MLNVVTSIYYCLTHKQESSAKLCHKLFFKNSYTFPPLDTVFNLQSIAFTVKHINIMQVFLKALNSIIKLK